MTEENHEAIGFVLTLVAATTFWISASLRLDKQEKLESAILAVLTSVYSTYFLLRWFTP